MGGKGDVLRGTAYGDSMRFPVRFRPVFVAVVVLLAGTAVSAETAPPSRALVPRTLVQSVPAGDDAVVPGFLVDFVAVTWDGEHGTAQVRFRHDGSWSPWQPMAEDGAQEIGAFGSALVPAGDADAYQVRVPAGVRGPRTVAINTTDGPMMTAVSAALVSTATMGSIQYVPRSAWGADESLRFDSGGTEVWPADYVPVQKLTVHHTATINDDPDPAATVRAIYRYHAIDRGWGDIGYQFLVDEGGAIYEGRHTDDDPATAPSYGDGPDTDTFANDGVVGGHVSGWNSGNTGVALLGTLIDRRPTAGAQQGAEQVLAELGTRSGIAPDASGTYINPVNGSTWYGPNIPGHRDFAATECPGGIAYNLLPTVRNQVADRVAQGSRYQEDTTAPVITNVNATTKGRVSWDTTGDPSDAQVRYWPVKQPGSVTTTPLDLQFVDNHSVSLSGLRKRTTYAYQAISADTAGNRTVSTVGSFTVS